MVNWEDREYVNPCKRIFKNLDTGETLNLEIQEDSSNILKESSTPLTAHNLNLMQTEMIEECGVIVSSTEPAKTKAKMWIDNDNKTVYLKNSEGTYEEFYKEKQSNILYSNEEGSSGDITLSEAVSNYEYIEVYYKVGTSFFFTKAYAVDGKNVVLNAYEWNEDRVHFRTKTINISGTSLKVNRRGLIELYNNQINFVSTDNSIFVTKVVGINKIL